jgi:hypothetical protein
VHRETITDPAKVQEIEAALRNKQAASVLAGVITLIQLREHRTA